MAALQDITSSPRRALRARGSSLAQVIAPRMLEYALGCRYVEELLSAEHQRCAGRFGS